MKPEYDLIICDCAPNLMTGTQNALYASDWFFIPMQPDFLSSIGLELLLDRLAYLRKSLEFKISCLGAAFTRVRAHLHYHQETMARLRDAKGLKRVHFFDTIIPENIKLAEAPMESPPHRPPRRLRHRGGSIPESDSGIPGAARAVTKC